MTEVWMEQPRTLPGGQRICSYCWGVIGHDPRIAPGEESHGIGTCCAKLLGEAQEKGGRILHECVGCSRFIGIWRALCSLCSAGAVC